MGCWNRLGVNCLVNIYSFEDFYEKASENELDEDLLLTSLNLDDNRPTSAFRWLLSNPVLHQSLSPDDSKWLRTNLINIRQKSPLNEYIRELEAIATAMIGEYWLLPLFHHRQTLRFEGDTERGIYYSLGAGHHFRKFGLKISFM